jgi:pimeloyl-ACP methyl ester carboxylesterase
MKPQVVCLPGIVAPAGQRYRPIIEAVGDGADLHLKELEVYREAAPPSDYSIEEELDAVDRFADARVLDRFHLIGYSGGGFISLAYGGTRSARVKSLALFEPARIPGPLTPDEQAVFDTLEVKLRGLNGADFMSAFVREQVKPGVQLPPPPSGPPSPEMQKRPAGIAALIRAFEAYRFERARLAQAAFPVFLAYGDQTHEIESIKAGVLASLFGEITIRRYRGVHHFVPPEAIYTADHVRALHELWLRAEELTPQLSR